MFSGRPATAAIVFWAGGSYRSFAQLHAYCLGTGGARPAHRGTLVFKIGDMLERLDLTRGDCCSMPHRVLNSSGRSRLSCRFYFDPGFDVRIVPRTSHAAGADSQQRWDRAIAA